MNRVKTMCYLTPQAQAQIAFCASVTGTSRMHLIGDIVEDVLLTLYPTCLADLAMEREQDLEGQQESLVDG